MLGEGGPSLLKWVRFANKHSYGITDVRRAIGDHIRLAVDKAGRVVEERLV